jgi:hypothetical protein
MDCTFNPKKHLDDNRTDGFPHCTRGMRCGARLGQLLVEPRVAGVVLLEVFPGC